MRISMTLMSGAVAAVAAAGSANAAIVSASGSDGNPNGSLAIFASGTWDGTANETAIAGFASTTNDGRARGFTVSYTSGSDGNFSESTPFIFQMYGQAVSTASSGTANRFAGQTRTVNNVASGFVIDGSLGSLSSAGTSGWASPGSISPISFTYYRNENSSFTVGVTTYDAGLYTGGQFYGTSGYFGFRFSRNGGTDWNYGWAYATGDSGYGAPKVQITSWGYNEVLNQGIAAGAVPAPGALALLGVAGVVGARRRR